MRRNRRNGMIGTLNSLAWNFLAFCLLLNSSMCGSAQEKLPPESVIHLQIAGLRNDKGVVLCALYSSPDGFPQKSEKAIAHDKSEISEHHATCRFSGVIPGRYAVSVFHDENSNGKLDTNFMGIPREGVGASNNAKGHFGPPKFDAAAFQFPGGRVDLNITIMYL
jgi:uncharacterized protein (DUF2141 family)